jgi:hypothetical protein
MTSYLKIREGINGHWLKRQKPLLTIFLVLTVLAGLYFRLKGLGKYPLAVDEYYLVQSVENILKHGLPKFNSSGYYDRGLIYQYTLAPLLLAGIKPEFAGRLIAVICNMLTLVPLYLFCKKVSGKLFAAVILFVFCFSVWEVEMARFARMYTAFQLIFVSYLYFLYKNLIENDKKSTKWLLILSFISTFVYEASIFLCLLNFIPFIWDEERKRFDVSRLTKLRLKFRYLALSVIVFLCAYTFLKTNFRYLGITESALLPSNLPQIGGQADSGGMLRMPKLLILTLYSSKVFLTLYIIPLAVMIFSIYKLTMVKSFSFSCKFSMITLIVLSVFNLFGLIVALAILFYLIGWLKKEDFKSGFLLMFVPIVLNFIFWTVFALKTDLWHNLFPYAQLSGTISSLKVLWKEFINYPYFYEAYALFRDVMRHYTFIIVGLIFLGITLLFVRDDDEDFRFRFLFALFIFLIILVNILNLTFFQTRYFFFIFPLTLVLAYSTVEKIMRFFFKDTKLQFLGFSLVVILILMTSEDFNVRHLVNIDTPKVNYRVNDSFALKSHYYPRWDTRTPAEIINRDSKKGDIIITNQQVNDFYLNRLSYVYIDYREADRFEGVSVDSGKEERWTGAGLIYSTNNLIHFLLYNANTKWFIVNTLYDINYLQQERFFKEFKKYAVYANSDSSAILYKIPPKPEVMGNDGVLE